MEFLVVTMTTQVPGWDVRRRPSRMSAPAKRHVRASWRRQGHLLRLWRPPLQPGEWRSLGLFAADDGIELEKLLASMPLQVYRTDDVTPLSPHPNDPSRRTDRSGAPTHSNPGGRRLYHRVHLGRSGGRRHRHRRSGQPAGSQIGRGSSPSKVT